MEQYLILARSVTYAQRMESVLKKAGIRSQIFRASRDLTDLGCAYALKVITANIFSVVYILRNNRLDPLKVFRFQDHSYQEVVL